MSPRRSPASTLEHQRRLQAVVDAHLDGAHRRVPAFVRAHYRSPGAVARRNARGVTDPLVTGWNWATWPVRALGGPDWSTTTATEDAHRALLVGELLRLPELDAAVGAVLGEAWAELDEELARLRQLPHLRGRSAAALEAELVEVLARAHGATDQAKELARTIACGVAAYVVTGKVAGSLQGVGAAVATNAYIAQAGFFSGLWYSAFGAPAWVAYAGMAAGALAGVLIMPLIGGAVEYGLNQRACLEPRFHEQIDRTRELLLHGAASTKRPREGLLESFARYHEQVLVAVAKLREVAVG